MMLAHFGNRIRIAGVDGAEEFLGLTAKLLQVGTDRQTADGHDEPPRMSPWSAGGGQRRFRVRPNVRTACSGGLGPVRGREAPCTPNLKLALSGDVLKNTEEFPQAV